MWSLEIKPHPLPCSWCQHMGRSSGRLVGVTFLDLSLPSETSLASGRDSGSCWHPGDFAARHRQSWGADGRVVVMGIRPLCWSLLGEQTPRGKSLMFTPTSLPCCRQLWSKEVSLAFKRSRVQTSSQVGKLILSFSHREPDARGKGGFCSSSLCQHPLVLRCWGGKPLIPRCSHFSSSYPLMWEAVAFLVGFGVFFFSLFPFLPNTSILPYSCKNLSPFFPHLLVELFSISQRQSVAQTVLIFLHGRLHGFTSHAEKCIYSASCPPCAFKLQIKCRDVAEPALCTDLMPGRDLRHMLSPGCALWPLPAGVLQGLLTAQDNNKLHFCTIFSRVHRAISCFIMISVL